MMTQASEFYPANVNPELEWDDAQTLLDVLHQAVKDYGHQVAFESFGVPLTFKELDQHALAFASYLQHELKVQPGDRIALMGPNCIPFVIAMWGIIRCGAIQVSINPLYTGPELQHQVSDAQAERIIIFSGSTSVLADVIDQTPIKQVICFSLDDLLDKGLPSPPIDSRLVDVKPFIHCLTSAAAGHFKAVKITADQTVFLQYTGGTTGISKGAMLSHGNIVANVEQFRSYTQAHYQPGEEVIITAIPMYHIFALTVNAICFLSIGAKNVLVTNPRDMSSFVELWRQTQPTAFTGVNTLYNGLLQQPEFATCDFSRLHLCIAGGAAMLPSVAKHWHEVTGCAINEGYGLSETSPVLTLNLGKAGEAVPGIGLPLPSTCISLRNEQGEEVETGDRGELCVKGPQVMSGYWNNPAATDEVMTEDGYFMTGDIAIQDVDGFYHIVDRKKDMILVSGFNVYPNEIESAATTMPAIIECACIGVADEQTGEAVKLFVVSSDPSLTAQDVIDYCRPRLTAYKVPKQIEFVSELPKSTVGKILRKDLR